MDTEESIDTLASLEQRVQRAVELLTSLRSENQDLTRRLEAVTNERDSTRGELDETRRQLSAAEAQVSQLSEDLHGLRDERKQVKSRIEKLLGQMDLLSAT
jgi:chromosome segregation ATPase